MLDGVEISLFFGFVGSEVRVVCCGWDLVSGKLKLHPCVNLIEDAYHQMSPHVLVVAFA